MARSSKACLSVAMCISVLLFFSMVLVDARSNPRKLLQLSSVDRLPGAAQDSSALFGGSASSADEVQYEPGIVVETILDGNLLNFSIYSTLAVPFQGFIYAIDSAASQLLRVWLNTDQGKGAGVARRVAGGGRGETGYSDGWGEDSLLDNPKGMAIDGDGNVYIADVTNGVIRKFSPAGYVTTVAGQRNRTGYGDGTGKNALFSSNFDLTYVPWNCSLLIADRGNRRLRMIQLKPATNCNSGASGDSLASRWKIVSIVFMVVSTMLSVQPLVALGREVLQRSELQRTVAPVLSLGENRNGEAGEEPNPGDREATRPLLANSAATHRSERSPDLMDFLEEHSQEREQGRPIDRLANSPADRSRGAENDSRLSISSDGEEGYEGTSTSQRVGIRSRQHDLVSDAGSMLTGPNDSIFSHPHTNSGPLASAGRGFVDEEMDRNLHLFSQNSGN